MYGRRGGKRLLIRNTCLIYPNMAFFFFLLHSFLSSLSPPFHLSPFLLTQSQAFKPFHASPQNPNTFFFLLHLLVHFYSRFCQWEKKYVHENWRTKEFRNPAPLFLDCLRTTREEKTEHDGKNFYWKTFLYHSPSICFCA